MRSKFKEVRLSLYILSLILSCGILFFLFASMFTSMGYKGFKKARETTFISEQEKVTVIIDAGHGGEDPGASDNGLIEKDLNLEISNDLNVFLTSFGYDCVMTRTDDKLLYGFGQENQKKHYDLLNRVKFTKEYENAIFVSIHMNKFPVEYCKGLQTFYSENNVSSKLLAESIQNNASVLQIDNKRKIKNGSNTIYVLENSQIPSVLVECGFLSNQSEAELLKTKDYKTALSFAIYCGIAEFLECEDYEN